MTDVEKILQKLEQGLKPVYARQLFKSTKCFLKIAEVVNNNRKVSDRVIELEKLGFALDRKSEFNSLYWETIGYIPKNHSPLMVDFFINHSFFVTINSGHNPLVIFFIDNNWYAHQKLEFE